MQVVNRFSDLNEDAAALVLFHIDAQLDVVEEIHARQAVRDHFDVVVHVVLEEVGHFHDIGVLETVSTEVV
jgi:hypothetical protein